MKIGYIDGSWDLFHAGHANILHKAASMCDRLIVGVATDELHEAKKGSPPTQPFKKRSDMVRRLRCVSDIVCHDSLDHEDYKDLPIDESVSGWHPDIRFVGTDHGSFGQEQIDGLLWCIRNGIQIIPIQYTVGISSTQIREELRGD